MLRRIGVNFNQGHTKYLGIATTTSCCTCGELFCAAISYVTVAQAPETLDKVLLINFAQ